ncbi:MAG TPA: hypothetical protein VFX28_08840, partial [Methylomirabilota bacterium]|nr:hypothetical protein [Methylomirabilota bacterium]
MGWRDKTELPTEINYHEDHFGIVQNNFGPLIRLGEGDEVRDVPHPLSPLGVGVYDFALGDTLVIALPERSVRVIALAVQPKEYQRPRIVGTLYVDAETADLVRTRFSFTPAAYLDAQLEDVSIVLDNALWEGRWWLPYRQEIEIRRRAPWLDVPARGIIRGRWEIDGYVFNLGLVTTWFVGREITALPKAERDAFTWDEPLDMAIQDVAEPVRHNDLERVRAEVQRIAGRRALSGLSPRRLGARRLSDLIRANRVEGLALGAGIVWRMGGDRLEARVLASYGFADGQVKGTASVADASGLELAAYREVRDVADAQVIAPVLNSIAAQEFGWDYGDYYLAEGARIGVRHAASPRVEWHAAVGREHVQSRVARATPAAGSGRPNPALGGTGVTFVRVGARRKSDGFAVHRDLYLDVVAEGGRLNGGATYARLWLAGHVLAPLAKTRLLLRAQGGAATADVPRHRAFVLGGRGTLLGDEFREWGGRRAALGHLEWRIPVGGLSIALGPFARIPASVTLAPYVAAGAAGGPVPGTPWSGTPDTRVTAGLAVECFGVVRFDVGMGLQSGR